MRLFAGLKPGSVARKFLRKLLLNSAAQQVGQAKYMQVDLVIVLDVGCEVSLQVVNGLLQCQVQMHLHISFHVSQWPVRRVGVA